MSKELKSKSKWIVIANDEFVHDIYVSFERAKLAAIQLMTDENRVQIFEVVKQYDVEMSCKEVLL